MPITATAPNIALDLYATVRVEGKCRHCAAGRTADCRHWCNTCRENFTDAQMKAATGSLPCGHDWDDLGESDLCGECEGTGEDVRLVPLAELFEAFASLYSQAYAR